MPRSAESAITIRSATPADLPALGRLGAPLDATLAALAALGAPRS